MLIFLKIAFRNILRNKLRSAITFSAIALGLSALIFIHAFVEGSLSEMIQNYTDLITGHIQIHRKDFHIKMGLERSIEEPDELMQRIKNSNNVVNVTKRIKEFALMSSTVQSSGIILQGIGPVNELNITKIHEKIIQGRFFSNQSNHEIILGKDLVDVLDVGVGKKVVLLGQNKMGELISSAYRVCGVIETGTEEIDKGTAFITLSSAQKLFGLKQGVSELAIRLNSVFESDNVKNDLNQFIDTDSYDVMTWKDISPFVAKNIEFAQTMISFILLIIIVVVATGILNTIMMSVLERIREFGLMMAIGTKRKQIILMVAFESMIIGFIGVFTGFVGGCGLSLYFAHYGLDMSGFSDAFSMSYMDSVIHPQLSMNTTIILSAVVFLMSVLMALYPAYKASRLNPSDAIRQY